MSQRLNGTLTLLPKEQHGHLRISVADKQIQGFFESNGEVHLVSGSIDDTVNLSIAFNDSIADLRFGMNVSKLRSIREEDVHHILANSTAEGTYNGNSLTAAYRPTPIKTPPRPQPAIGTPLPVERLHGGSYRIG